MRIFSSSLDISCNLPFLSFSYNLASITYNRPYFFFLTLVAVCIPLFFLFQHQLRFNFNYLQYKLLFYTSCSLFLTTYNMRLLFYPSISVTAYLLPSCNLFSIIYNAYPPSSLSFPISATVCFFLPFFAV